MKVVGVQADRESHLHFCFQPILASVARLKDLASPERVQRSFLVGISGFPSVHQFLSVWSLNPNQRNFFELPRIEFQAWYWLSTFSSFFSYLFYYCFAFMTCLNYYSQFDWHLNQRRFQLTFQSWFQEKGVNSTRCFRFGNLVMVIHSWQVSILKIKILHIWLTYL